MSKISCLVIGLLMTTIVFSKLLHNQALTQDPNMSYYEALLAKENDLKLALSQIQSSITYLNQTLAQVQNSTDLKIVALNDALSD